MCVLLTSHIVIKISVFISKGAYHPYYSLVTSLLNTSYYNANILTPETLNELLLKNSVLFLMNENQLKVFPDKERKASSSGLVTHLSLRYPLLAPPVLFWISERLYVWFPTFCCSGGSTNGRFWDWRAGAGRSPAVSFCFPLL